MATKRSSIIPDLGSRATLLVGVLLLVLVSLTEGASSSDRRMLLTAAQDIIDNDRPRYRFGANGEGGRYDCSSFLVEAARRGGVGGLPRTSRDQFEYLRDHGMVWTRGMRGWGGLIPGDLVFYSGTYSHGEDNPISHVMIYAGGGRVVGAQNSGVGYHKFTPTLPLGEPGRDGQGIRRKKTVYAYARPDWTRIRLAGKMGGRDRTMARVRDGGDGGWEKARWDSQKSRTGDGGWETGWHFSGEARTAHRTIKPSTSRDIAVTPGARGVWLP